MDFRKAYDDIVRDSAWICIERVRVPKKVINLTQICILKAMAKVGIGKHR